MGARLVVRIAFMLTVFKVANAKQTGFYNYDDYFYAEPEMKDEYSLNAIQSPNKLFINGLTSSDKTVAESPTTATETTECDPPSSTLPPQEPVITTDVQQTPERDKPEEIFINREDEDDKTRELKMLVQLLYIAQARVQLEAAEIKKSQAVANSAQQSLEEAANHVRTMTANLKNSQQEVASAAIRAQTAQLKLAAHDQLLFAARQDVDALSTQLVSLQAAEGINEPKSTVDLADLLQKLKQPLQESEKPTPVPSLVQISTQATNQQQNHKLQHYNALDYHHFYYN